MSKKVIACNCAMCKKPFSLRYGIEHGIQYGDIQIEEATYPWSTATNIKHYARICTKCLNKLKEEIK